MQRTPLGGGGRGGSINMMQLLAGGMGGVPIAGTAIRQFSLLHMILGDDGASLGEQRGAHSAAKTRASAYRAWRDIMEPSKASGGIMDAFKKFGPGAIVNRLSKSWNVLANYGQEKANIMAGDPREIAPAMATLNKAAMGAAIDFAIVGGSVIAVGAAVIKFGKAISDSNRQISGYSPMMAASYAISDIRDVFRDMKSAQVRAPIEARFQTSFGNFKDAVRPITDACLNAIESLATTLLDIITPLIKVVNHNGGLTTNLRLLDTLGKEASISVDTWKKVFHGDWQGVKENAFKGAGLYKDYFFGGKEGSKHSGIDDAQQAIKDNIEALKANTEALKASMGKDDGMMLAGDFMRGVVNADSGFRVKQRALPQGKHHGTPTRGPMHAHAAANAHPGAKQGLPPPRVGPPAGHAMAWEAGADEG